MHFKLKNGMRGPVGSIHKVYVKLYDHTRDGWYIIRATDGFDVDNSHLQEDDDIVLNLLDLRKGERPPVGYTFVPDYHGMEVNDITSNKEAKNLLEKDY